MYKAKIILLFLVHVYVSYIFRNKRVYILTGLRRSGNHAFINWVANALEGTEISFADIAQNVSKTKSGKTLLYNEVNYFGAFWFVNTLRSTTKYIKNASFIIISLEDYIPRTRDEFIPNNAIKISIKRNTLNVIASRLQRLIQLAKNGLDRGDMGISKNIISYLKWQQKANEKGYLVWSFDKWIDDRNYRSEFLTKINLKSDISPSISTQGDGSSFSGQSKVPNKKELMNRWDQVDWPDRVLKMLSDITDTSILNDEEQSFISTQLQRISREK